MSMPALLSHFGIDSSRFVTQAGRIVFDGVTKTSNGFVHETFGTVTPVATHTFHGGVGEPTDGADGAFAWWDDEEQIGREIDAMKSAFPGFVYVPPETDAVPCWGGVIDTGRGMFKVGVFARHDRGLPKVTVLHPRHLGAQRGGKWQKPPHLYLNGNLCVADRQDWDDATHTVATATTWAAHWLAAYTEWRITRHWPVEGVRSALA